MPMLHHDVEIKSEFADFEPPNPYARLHHSPCQLRFTSLVNLYILDRPFVEPIRFCPIESITHLRHSWPLTLLFVIRIEEILFCATSTNIASFLDKLRRVTSNG